LGKPACNRQTLIAGLDWQETVLMARGPRGSNRGMERGKKTEKKGCETTKPWYSAIARDLFFDKLQTSRKGFPRACDRETAAGCWRLRSTMIEPALGKCSLEGGIPLPMTNLQ
jgi:hypothetical protein